MIKLLFKERFCIFFGSSLQKRRERKKCIEKQQFFTGDNMKSGILIRFLIKGCKRKKDRLRLFSFPLISICFEQKRLQM